MIKSFKKNQIIIAAIAFLLVMVGYLSYSMSTEQVAETFVANSTVNQIAAIGDARLVSSNNITEANSSEVASQNQVGKNEMATEVSQNAKAENQVATTTAAAKTNANNYFAESRLEREKMYSEMLASYQALLANNDISAEQKNNAQQEISKINKQRNAIMIAENLIKNKGFDDVVIFVNNESVSSVVKKENLETAEIAQIQSIIQRELNVKVENIHISNK